MRITVLSMALMVAVGAPQAWAQQQGGSSTVQKDKPSMEAPIGHRQPRRGEIGNEKNLSNPDSAMNKEDAALDKRIKSICRGC